MRVETVEIVGFKSFCDRQELSFRGGVTGIVGPNGCGKSNISDAISWVLGEQSVKSLRGSSMEDVIFAGSQSRQPLGMAEVNLKVSGLNGSSPDGSPECVVTRRLYRNGESEYLMNGEVCRLRDIHELFMDTGLGSKAYSIIEQGKIGLILSGKPADRRALIEEAAGITKYRARRRQTSFKLEAAQQNLLRVNDIIHEVEKQLESLKRQASRARRYRVVREEMQGVERVLFGLRFLDLTARAQGLEARRGAEAEREQAVTIALEAEEAHTEARRHALYEEEARLQEVRGRLHELTLELERQQSRSGYCQEQITQAETRATEAAQEAAELEARVNPLREALQTRREESARLGSERDAAEQETQAQEAAVQEATARQAAAEQTQEEARDAQVEVMGRSAALQNSRAALSARAERAGADLLKLAAEGQELESEYARVVEMREGARARGAEAERLRAGLLQDRDAAASRAGEARARAEARASEAELWQSERDGLAGRRASLEEIVATHAAFDEGTRALLAGPEGVEVLGVVADALETDSVHERAVEAFLGDRLQAVLTPDSAHALRGIRYLQEGGAGRGTFLPLAAGAGRREGPSLSEIAPQEARVLGLLSNHYRVTGPHAEAIRAALPEALLVESLEDALAIVSRQGPVPCVTLAGETLRGSLVEGGRGVKGLLAPRREIREVKAREEELGGLLGAARSQEAEETATAERADAEARQLDERIHAAEKDLVVIGKDLAAAEEENVRLDRKAGTLETERSQAEQEQGAAALRLAEIDLALQAAEAEREGGSLRLAGLATEVAEARTAAEASQARWSEARSTLAALRERLAAVEADGHRLEQDQAELGTRILGARERGREMAVRREQLVAERREIEGRLAQTLVERDQVTLGVARAEDRVRDLRNELEGRELSLKERRRERDLLRDALSELEVAGARTASDLDHLGRECEQAVGQTAAQAAAGLGEEDKAGDVAALTARVQELRDKLERMGAVNILAVEQAQELEERHTFLVAQRQDLLESIAELDQAIKKIDRTSKERFAEAFQVINQHFGEVFRRLFGGGTAGLSLIDEEDLLESGIDVMAQPPGKRLQNVMLLSGGEKALTAIALLFAIFQHKPSPFCILDEVDAPLDDANIGRFAKMLEGMKDQTQFVLITHSRKTMEIADQLYGVTMEEPGVSKLVSVKFGQ
jgi:chromosome segregation protein